MILHAGLIARYGAGGWRGVLIEGPSGAGKSDLALRALDAGWALVADDRVRVWRSGDQLYGRAAPALAGLIEARGIGVLPVAARGFAVVSLAVQCSPRNTPIERMPEFQARDLLGVVIPALRLNATDSSAPAKLALALRHLGLLQQPAYQACRVGAPPSAATGGDP